MDIAFIEQIMKISKEIGLKKFDYRDEKTSIVLDFGSDDSSCKNYTGISQNNQVLPVLQNQAPPSSVFSGEIIKSTMVGSVYLSNSPEEKNFVSVGTNVVHGQTIMIIEAMKVMNFIKAPRDGTIKSILVKNGQPVEFGDELFVLE